MKKQKQNYFLNLLKATRVVRVLIPLSSIMLIVGFANHINKEIFILTICCVLIYSAGGIFNAKTDKDFKLKHSLVAVIFLFLIALILSFSNYIIFFSVFAWVLLSFIYNKFSRKILFGDSVILAITHAVIPIVGASLLLNLDFRIMFIISGFMFVAFFLIIPMKNLSQVVKDKKRKYKTLMTQYKNGKQITNWLLNIHVLLLFLAYFIFSLNNKYLLIFASIIIITIFVNFYLRNGKETQAYYLSRLIFILFSFAIVYAKTTNTIFILMSASMILIYLAYLYILKWNTMTS